jgi:hypothetical protein
VFFTGRNRGGVVGDGGGSVGRLRAVVDGVGAVRCGRRGGLGKRGGWGVGVPGVCPEEVACRGGGWGGGGGLEVFVDFVCLIRFDFICVFLCEFIFLVCFFIFFSFILDLLCSILVFGLFIYLFFFMFFFFFLFFFFPFVINSFIVFLFFELFFLRGFDHCTFLWRPLKAKSVRRRMLHPKRDIQSHASRREGICTVRDTGKYNSPRVVHDALAACAFREARQSLAASIPFPKRLGGAQEYADLVLHLIQNNTSTAK